MSAELLRLAQFNEHFFLEDTAKDDKYPHHDGHVAQAHEAEVGPIPETDRDPGDEHGDGIDQLSELLANAIAN